jgi:hypothetical protein
MREFFNIFRKPTIKSQADHYPTCHNVIPDYLHMIGQLNVWQIQNQKNIIQKAAKAAHKVLSDYFNKSLATRHHLITTIYDPRYKLKALAFFSQATRGLTSPLAKKGKAHFEHVFSQYNRRTIGIKEYKQQKAVNDILDADEEAEDKAEDD